MRPKLSFLFPFEMEFFPSSLSLLLPIIFFALTSTATSLSQSATIELRAARGRYNYCDSWRLSVETNNAGTWRVIPSKCLNYVKDYINGPDYALDCKVVAEEALEFAKTVKLTGDGKDAWVFDVDDTLLSNLPYYQLHGYGSEPFNETLFDPWVESAGADAIPSSLKLYKKLKKMGFTLFILTGRDEDKREVTVKNLSLVGYSSWKKLILRGASDDGKAGTMYKSEKRAELMKRGYKIHGSYGDQWSDLWGFAVAERSFKLPNPLYYIK